MAIFRSLLLLGGLLSAVQSQATAPENCPKGLHIIAARGHGTAKGYGGLNLTVAAIKAQVKGTTSWAVPYYTYPSPNYNFQAEVMNGTRVMNTNVREFVKSCPNSAIVLMGYSEGAVIMMNLLCGASSQGFTPSDPLPSSFAKNMIGIIALGDETRTLFQPYNVGTCTGQGIFPRSNPGGCSAYAPVIQSYCDTPDPECCRGNNETVHHQYPAEYDGDIAAYIGQQYSSFRVANPTTSTAAAVKTKTTATSTSAVTTASTTAVTSSVVSSSIVASSAVVTTSAF